MEPAAPKVPSSALDRPAARFVALGVIFLVVSGLAYFHRDDFWPPEDLPQSPESAAFLRCLAARGGDIDRLRRDGMIDESRAALFKARAEALCRDQADGVSARPPPG